MREITSGPGVDVLLTTAANAVGRQVFRSLTAHGLKVAVSDTSLEALQQHCRGAEAYAVLPDAARHPQDHARRLAEKLQELGAKAVIPVFYPEVAAQYAQMLPEGALLPLDDARKLARLDDKCRCSRLAADLGIPQPRIYTDFDEIGEYPVVFKRPAGLGGSAVYFPATRASLDKLAASADSSLVMEYVPGYDICVDAVRWDGYFRAGAYKVILPRRKGFSVLRESVDMPQVLESARAILDAVDFRGVCGLDFRVDERDGRVLFLECNPRFSGGLASQRAAGFDVPWELWQLCNGADPGNAGKPVRAGVRTMSLEGARRMLKSPKMCLRDKLKCLFPGTLRFDECL